MPEDSAALVEWARLQSDRAATLEERGRWRECLEECDKGILRLADAESTALLDILVRIRVRRMTAARALRAAGEEVPPMPCPAPAAPEGETTVGQTKGPETEVGAPVPQTEEGYICPECNVPKRRDSEHFSPDPRSSDGLRKKCRQCQEAIQKAGWEKRRNGAAKPAGTPPADLAHSLRVIVDPEDEEHFNPEGSLARVRTWKERLEKCVAVVERYDRDGDARGAIATIGEILGVPVFREEASAQLSETPPVELVAEPPAVDGLLADSMAQGIRIAVMHVGAIIDRGVKVATFGLAADAARMLAQLGHADLVADALATAMDDLAGKAGQ